MTEQRDPTQLERVEQAAFENREAVEGRDAAIRLAHKNGWSIREIARAVDLSSTRVHQIVKDS